MSDTTYMSDATYMSGNVTNPTGFQRTVTGLNQTCQVLTMKMRELFLRAVTPPTPSPPISLGRGTSG